MSMSMVQVHMSRISATVVALLASLAPGLASALPVGDLWLSEVMVNPNGGDNGREWIELYNASGSDIDLSGYSLGWGGADYATDVLQLSGVIAAGDYFVVGGPTSDVNNANPSYDQVANFTPDLQNPFLFSDGIALFDVTAASVTSTTQPIHVVIYGGAFGNVNGLIDEQGNVGAVDVGSPGAGESLQFDGAGWAVQASPSPSWGLLVQVPEPGAAGLLLLAAVALRRRVRVSCS
jgi:hypothetical protein